MDPHAVQRLNVGAALPLDGSSPERVEDEIGAAMELGLTHLRFLVPWAQVQPKPAVLDGGLIERLRSAATVTRAAGLEPWFLLAGRDVPRWFENDGGWLDASTAGRAWPRWVEAIADALGDVAAAWVPFEAPYAMSNRIIDDPRRHGEVADTLLVAWRDAWRILGGPATGRPMVHTSIDVKVERPADETIQEGERVRRADALRWRLWLQGLRDGIISIPGRADRELPDLAGACDVIGIATTDDVETVLYRAAEMAPTRPLGLTFRATGDDEVTRNAAAERMWRDAQRSGDEIGLRSVTMIVDRVGESNSLFERP